MALHRSLDKRGVRRLHDRIRISVQLTQGPRQIWADRFDSHADEILAVQDEIVARVAAALALRSISPSGFARRKLRQSRSP